MMESDHDLLLNTAAAHNPLVNFVKQIMFESLHQVAKMGYTTATIEINIADLRMRYEEATSQHVVEPVLLKVAINAAEIVAELEHFKIKFDLSLGYMWHQQRLEFKASFVSNAIQ